MVGDPALRKALLLGMPYGTAGIELRELTPRSRPSKFASYLFKSPFVSTRSTPLLVIRYWFNHVASIGQD